MLPLVIALTLLTCLVSVWFVVALIALAAWEMYDST